MFFEQSLKPKKSNLSDLKKIRPFTQRIKKNRLTLKFRRARRGFLFWLSVFGKQKKIRKRLRRKHQKKGVRKKNKLGVWKIEMGKNTVHA